jgi:hypothetical protein
MKASATPRNSRRRAIALVLGLAAALPATRAGLARELETESSAPVPCAIIAEVGGQVDVLDASRSRLLDSSEKAAVACGSWISVGRGSVELKHRDGFRIHAGAGTFMQLPEPNTDGHFSGDQVILYRGQVFAQAGGGSGQLRVATANARARVERGSAIVVFSQEDEETQLIALDRSSTLENRFETARRVTAKAGEATALNFKQLRVVPGTPRAVAIAALRPKFDDLHVPERDRKGAFRTAHDRQERIFATELVPGDDQVSDNPGEDVRARLKHAYVPASPSRYSSRPSDDQVRAIRKSWTGRLAAGETGAGRLIAPAPKAKATGSRSIASQDMPARGKIKPHGRLTAEDEEKLRLIEELSRIHDE